MSVASTFLLNSDAFATNSAAFALVLSVFMLFFRGVLPIVSAFALISLALSAVFVERVFVFEGARLGF